MGVVFRVDLEQEGKKEMLLVNLVAAEDGELVTLCSVLGWKEL